MVGFPGAGGGNGGLAIEVGGARAAAWVTAGCGACCAV